MNESTMTKDNLKQIIIIGGGAAGLQLATKLGHKLGKNKLANITLIDKNLSYLWKPLWHEVAAGRIDVMKDKTEYLAHGNAHGFNFIMGEFAEIDRNYKVIKLNKTTISEQEAILPAKIHYDYLVMAIGSVHNNFNTPGVDEHCITFDNLSECEYFHDKLMFQLLKLFQSPNQELNIAIIGGGSTGVELAFEIKGTINELFSYNNVSKDNLKVNLSIIESSPSILANLDDELIAESTKP